MQSTQYLIIGAGITGLAFAGWIDSDDYLICEADREIGGYCKTVSRNGFTWDYSGHFFHFKHPEIERYLLERMPEQQIFKVQKCSKIAWNDGWIDFPFQKNIHQLPFEDFVDCIYGLHFRPTAPPANFKEMLYAKFGVGIAERFLIPYNEKLYATDLCNLDLNAMGRFFPYADVSQIIRNLKFPDNSSYNDTFTYPSGGAIQYIHALAERIPPERILLEERLVKLDLKERVAHTTRRNIKYEAVISSAPLNRLLECCQLPFDASHFHSNKVLVFNFGFDSRGMRELHWAYFPQRDLSFYRVGFYDNIGNGDRMSLYVEVGLEHNADVSTEIIDRLRERALYDLRKAGILTSQRLVDWHHVVMDPAYVHITQQSLEDTAKFKRILANHGVHSIGRYGGWTYCSIEDNIVEARQLADTFNAVEPAR
jgi:protoporphyrinogen oxidase